MLDNQALGDTFRIMRATDLDNPVVKDALSEMDDLENWGKYGNKQQVTDPVGNNLQIHYYYNDTTGQVYYDMDYKVKINGQNYFQIQENTPQNYYGKFN